MILLTKHRVDLELICQQKQTKINRDNTRKNKHRFDYDYKVGDKFMLNKHDAYEYMYNIRLVNPYQSDPKVDDYNYKNMSDNVRI